MFDATRTDDISPFFIIGSGRSGTTLLATMLNTHGAIDIPRAEALYSIYGSYVPAPTGSEVLSERRWQRLLKVFATDVGVLSWKYPPDLSVLDTGGAERNFGGAYRLLHETHAACAGKTHWGVKQVGGEMLIDRLLADFPGAKFIYCLRDGRAVARSLTENDFGPTTLVSGARHWSASVRAWREATRTIPPGQHHTLKYEDLVAAPETSLRAVLDFLDMPWDAGCLDYHRSEFAQTRARAREHANLARAPDTALASRALRELTAQQIGRIEAVARDELQSNGYTPITALRDMPVPRERRRERLRQSVERVTRYVLTTDPVRRGSFFQRHRRRLFYSLWAI